MYLLFQQRDENSLRNELIEKISAGRVARVAWGWGSAEEGFFLATSGVVEMAAVLDRGGGHVCLRRLPWISTFPPEPICVCAQVPD